MTHTVKEFILPDEIASTSFPAVEATCKSIGIRFDRWQQDLNRAILAKTVDGLYAADTVAMSIPRQVGKTFDIGALVFADSIINAGTTTVWTAHRFKVSRETFNELKTWARSPLLAPHIDHDAITTGAGNEMIPFRNGSRIVFAARERGAIRGFTKVERLILDEAQILSESGMADLAPTMNQATNPQIIMMGTPPKPGDDGEVFTETRRASLAGESEAALYVEYASEPDASVDPTDENFWDGIEQANPSYPDRTSRRAILRLRKLLSDEDFRREVLGIWDAKQHTRVFKEGIWEAGLRKSRPGNLQIGALGVASSLDGEHSAIVAGARDGGDYWIKVLATGAGIGWVADEARRLSHRHETSVVVDGRGPAAMLAPVLRRDDVEVIEMTTPMVLNACGNFDQLVNSGRLLYEESEALEEAVDGAQRRRVGDRWAWGRKQSSNIAPLEAATLAVWAAESFEPEPVSAYESGGGVMTV